MEFVFNNKINYLCDQETKVKDLNENNKSNKRIILYYRFSYNSNKYLFFKLEEYNMNNIEHLIKLINLNRKDIYDKRRENEINYDTYLQNKDESFNNKIITKLLLNENDILSKIKFYNENLRTGRELFIFEELKEYLLSTNIDEIKIEL